jgi:hypothetical protein
LDASTNLFYSKKEIKMTKQTQFLLLTAICLLFVFSFNKIVFASEDHSSKVDRYIEMLSSNSSILRINAAKSIFHSGFADPKISNKLNDILTDNYQTNNINREYTEEMSWMCKAISVSSSNEYRPTLLNIVQTTQSIKLKKYAKKSLNLLSRYSQTVRSTSNQEDQYNDPSISKEVNRLINMIRSNNTMKKREAAKSVSFGYYTEKQLYDAIKDELLKGYMHTSMDDRHFTDALDGCVKHLGHLI